MNQIEKAAKLLREAADAYEALPFEVKTRPLVIAMVPVNSMRQEADALEACIPDLKKALDIVSMTEESVRPPGAWLVYGTDMAAYPIALFSEEIDARRRAESYDHVKFWEFGTDWKN